MYGYVMEGGRASLTMRQIGGVWFAVAVLPRSGFWRLTAVADCCGGCGGRGSCGACFHPP